ncbi:TlpA family protein disulfide reductase [Sphingobacterium psychroaquaticum]|uniref:Thiol-disulfide isomerase or thioredoxin n=1 Tax=Sphingobacterium psychroaquaticum TaxID=561061 RepID=A0A1X7KML2_9SPHI|nr:TlpA disulfide reductase family protein [Sphingobacterium psychroaquaticum]SMG42708.1 Thiol-disulfide isomerase or thioredoxin [Sphingobacterium psychroaquaticum]
MNVQKKIMLLLMAVVMCCSTVVAQKAFLMEGTVPISIRQVLIGYDGLQRQVYDTVATVGGKIYYQGAAELPVKVMVLDISDPDNDFPDVISTFYVDQEKVMVSPKSDGVGIYVYAGATQAEFETLQEKIDSIKHIWQTTIMPKYDLEDRAQVNVALDEFAPHREQIPGLENAFIAAHPRSYASLDILSRQSHLSDDAQSLLRVWEGLDDRLKHSKEGEEVYRRLLARRKLDRGVKMDSVALKSVSDKEIDLKTLRGKYVLVDFWASWCGPCRGENPNLIAAYEELPRDKFEIYAISLDTNKEEWKNAIKEDGLPWIHVSDLVGMKKGGIAFRYGINAIPQNVLLDPNGIIVGKDLRGERIAETIREIMAKVEK